MRQLRKELGTSHGTIQRVAEQLGYGTESVRSWVKQADIDDGEAPGIRDGAWSGDEADGLLGATADLVRSGADLLQ